MDYKTPRFFWVLFSVVALIFLIGTVVVSSAGAGDVFVSPDETTNAFFSRNFSQTGTFFVKDALSGDFFDALHPRSMVVRNGILMPGSFLGLPMLYGAMSFIFGDWILLLLTPLIAIFSALAIRRIFSVFFSQKVSDISALIFLTHPAVWYYSARGLMHNVLFVCLLILSAYFFYCRPIYKHLKRCENRLGRLRFFQKTIDIFASGILIGFSLFVRASEVYWVAIVIALLGLFHIKKNGSKEIFLLFIGVVIGLFPFFYFNFATYGNPFITGYTVPVLSNGLIAQEQIAQSPSFLFPFGVSMRSVIQNVSDYGMILFWWLSVLALIGIMIAFVRQKFYVILFLIISIWLGIWYGSWVLFDNPDTTQITIANSYVRYWLPIFVLSIPFISEAIVWTSSKGRTKLARNLFLVSIIVFIVGLNVRIVFFEGQDALTRVADILRESRQTKKEVLALTQPDSVIIVDRGDKLFFPDRHVRYPLRSEATYSLMPKIAEKTSLYYFGITFPQGDLDYLNQSKLKGLGLQIKHIKTFSEESLYYIFP
ncbi:hypothetical protein HYV69_02280 [Candidatus Uhrbacteria bacterium]|nr:hypothetical protein [Candidatus Uhrbacteria bacterium]